MSHAPLTDGGFGVDTGRRYTCGLMGVGGGALSAVLSPTLCPLRMHAHKLIATDTIHAIPASLLGGLSYLILRLTDLQMLRICSCYIDSCSAFGRRVGGKVT